MKELYKMTKEELVATCRRLQSENERLQYELDNLSDCYTELENRLVDITSDEPCIIHDVNNFKFRLQIDEVMTPQLESFIEDYLRFYNRKE